MKFVLFIFLSFLVFSKESNTIDLEKAIDIFYNVDILKEEKLKNYLDEVKKQNDAKEVKSQKDEIEKEIVEFIYNIEFAKYQYYYLLENKTAKTYIKNNSKKLNKIVKYSKNSKLISKESRQLISRYVGLNFLVGMLCGAFIAPFYSGSFVLNNNRAIESKNHFIKQYSRLDRSIFNIMFAGFSGGMPGLGLRTLQKMFKDDNLNSKLQLQFLLRINMATGHQKFYEPKKALGYINMGLELYPQSKILIKMKKDLISGDYGI